MDAAIAAVWRFRPSATGRLAGMTGVAVDRAVMVWRRGVDGSPIVTPGRARSGSAPLEDWSRRIGPWQRFLDPDPRLLERLETLEETAQRVVTARFGLTGRAPMTVDEIAAELGLTGRRVRRILVEARADARAHARAHARVSGRLTADSAALDPIGGE